MCIRDSIKTLLAMYLSKADIQVILDKITKKFLTTQTFLHDQGFNLNSEAGGKDSLPVKSKIDDLKAQLEKYKRKLKEVSLHKEIIEFNRRKRTITIPHKNCDKQESACLSILYKLLKDGMVADAKRFIQWRRGILELAEYSGWEVARLVARNTCSKLAIEAKDIICVCLLCLIRLDY
eukprot:TRINITY_DN9562_c0_g5_i4.p1 TRINITY_DN9562_c0_g5~~TRINITY_DN9562_c0_g5_i4.p1  ORF type:complete len:178 (-),score=14.91 TRINITY_DN9562_c0_g5_i4:155-688(-)